LARDGNALAYIFDVKMEFDKITSACPVFVSSVVLALSLGLTSRPLFQLIDRPSVSPLEQSSLSPLDFILPKDPSPTEEFIRKMAVENDPGSSKKTK
jgi:hypothetical protein